MSMPKPDDMPPQFQTPKRSRGMGCLMGCLGTLLVMVLICGGIGIWGYYYGPAMVVGQIRDVAVKTIEESELAPEDKQEVIKQINRVVDKYRAGEINSEELVNVFKELSESPVMAVFVLYAAEEKYIKPSGLTEEEKAEARLTLQRVLRGVVEKKIDPKTLEDATNIIMEGTGDQKNIKEKLTDDELKSFVAELKKHADAAAIPEEPYEVRIGQEVKKAVDRALGEEPAVKAEVEP